MRSWLAYRWRSLCTAVFDYECACSSRRCGRPRVGISAWCRGHTDAIMYGGVDPSREVETPRYFPTDQERVEKWGVSA